MPDRFKIIFIAENCIQCRACEVACKSWRDVEAGVSLRSIVNLYEGEYPVIKHRASSQACVHCEEPLCIETCPAEAIAKDGETGLVLVDRELCSGCQLCLESCPFNAPQFGADGKMQICDLCHDRLDLHTTAPPCVSTCPTGALVLQKEN